MKKSLAWSAIGLLIGTTLLWPLVAQSASDAGKSIYNDKCALCHGLRGDGNGPAGAALSPKATDFTSSQYWQTANSQKIAAATRNGVDAMPGFEVNPEQMQALIDYLRTFQR